MKLLSTLDILGYCIKKPVDVVNYIPINWHFKVDFFIGERKKKTSFYDDYFE